MASNRDARALVMEARASLPALQAACAPGGEMAVKNALAVIMVDRPPNKTEAHMIKLTQLMVNETKDFPIEAIKEGTMDVLRDSSILGFPNLAQFRDKVKARAELIRAAAYRARRIAEYQLPKPPPSPEDKARVRAMMSELNGILGGKRPSHA